MDHPEPVAVKSKAGEAIRCKPADGFHDVGVVPTLKVRPAFGDRIRPTTAPLNEGHVVFKTRIHDVHRSRAGHACTGRQSKKHP
jgi:hypothetical protein